MNLTLGSNTTSSSNQGYQIFSSNDNSNSTQIFVAPSGNNFGGESAGSVAFGGESAGSVAFGGESAGSIAAMSNVFSAISSFGSFGGSFGGVSSVSSCGSCCSFVA